MRKYLVSLISIVLMTCTTVSLGNSCLDLIDKDPVEEKMIKAFKEKYDLDLVGIGISSPEGIIREKKLLFELNNILSKDEARRLIVACASEYLKGINEDESLKSSLICYPFKIENIAVDIYVALENLPPPTLRVVLVRRGRVEFYYEDPMTLRLNLCEEETYEEALAKVKEQGS